MEARCKIALKVISILLFLCIIIGIISIANNPARRYELSLFNTFSIINWALLLLPLIGGIGITIFAIYNKNNYWRIGLTLILLTNLTIVLLPYLKGYAFSGSGDHLSHLGYIKDILYTGHLSLNNIYPVTHILAAQLCYIFDISPEIIINFIGPLFYLLFVLFSYLFAVKIVPKSAAILSVISSTVLFCYYYNQIFPMGFAFITFPLVFYLYFNLIKHRMLNTGVLLVLMIIIMVPFHPVASMLLTVALMLMEIGRFIHEKKFLKNSVYHKQRPTLYLNLAIISLCCLLTWIWNYYYVWNHLVTSVVGWFTSELFIQPMTEKALEAFDKLGLNLVGQLVLFIKSYGATFIYLVLSIFAIFLVLVNNKIRSENYSKNIIVYSFYFIPLTVVWLVDYIRPLSTLSSGRMIWAETAIFPVLVGFTLYLIGGFQYGEKKETIKKNLSGISLFNFSKVTSVGLIIAICSIIGILAFYPSPYRLQPYWGVTHSVYNSGVWLIEKGNPSLEVSGIGVIDPDRIAHALHGVQVRKYHYPALSDLKMPDHFGYDDNHFYGQSVENNQYLSLLESGKLYYTELWPQTDRFTLDDFNMLEDDNSINRIYSNNSATNYLARAVSSKR